MCWLQVSLSSTVAHENMVQLLDVFAEGTELIIVVSLRAGQHGLQPRRHKHDMRSCMLCACCMQRMAIHCMGAT